MIGNVTPIQMASGKGGSARQRFAGNRPVPDGFLALLQEMSGPSRQEGFSASKPPRQQARQEQEMDVLQRRIQHVNRLLLTFTAQER